MTRTWPTGGPTGCSGVVDMAAEATEPAAPQRAPSFFGSLPTDAVGQRPKNGSALGGLPVLDRSAAEGRRRGVLLAVAEVADLHGVAGLGGGHGGPHIGA